MLEWILFPAVLSGVFAECEKLYAADPAGRDGPRCFYYTALKGGGIPEALPRVEELRAANPENPWLSLYVATLRHHRGDPAALEAYTTATEGFARRGDPEGEVNARGNKAVFLRTNGHFGEAADEVERALAAGERGGNPKALRLAKGHLARHLYVTNGDLGRAERLYVEVEREIFPTGDYAEQVNCLRTLSGIVSESGRLDEALTYMRRAHQLATAAGDVFSSADTRFRAARLWREILREADDASSHEELIAEFRAALEDARRAGNRFTEAEIQSHLGFLVEDGIPHLEACLALEGQMPDLQIASECRWGIARRVVTKDPARALAMIEQSRAQAAAAGDAPFLALYLVQVAKLRALAGRKDEAITAWERALDALDGLSDMQPSEEVRRGVTAKWSTFYYGYAGWLLQQGELARAFAATERLRARDLHRHLAAAHIPEAPPLQRLELHELAATIGEDEAILSYQVAPRDDDGGGGSWVLVITRGGTHAARLPARGKIEPAVRLFAGLVERRDGAERAAAQRLHEQLVAPALAGLPPGVRHLVIIPDGALHRLPFAALTDAEGRTLASRHRLSIAPSATLWAWWRRTPAAPPVAPVLVLADPGGGDALPAARREGQAIADMLGGGRLLEGAQASRSALRGIDAGHYRVVHFAAHALVDEGLPHRSAILLADGRLEPAEIAALPLGRSVVVLAACRSAGGTDQRGEGVLGLGHAFFRAGAPVVVGSLWPLRDEEAGRLFSLFYGRLVEGDSVAEALRSAQAELAAAGVPDAAWAGVVALGDGDVVPFPRRRAAVPGWLLVAAAAAIAFAVGRLRRSRPKPD